METGGLHPAEIFIKELYTDLRAAYRDARKIQKLCSGPLIHLRLNPAQIESNAVNILTLEGIMGQIEQGYPSIIDDSDEKE